MSDEDIRRATRWVRADERIRAARLACEGLAGDLLNDASDLESCLYRAESIAADLREALEVMKEPAP